MKTLDLLYRAYTSYRNVLSDNREHNAFHKTIKGQRKQVDVLTMTRYACEISEDWVREIEKGLVYIGKAISEDRQFIRNEGEVLPIEKIRRVSQDAIVDLAKRSEYITRLPEDEDDMLVPERLLMIQRENDYHIYENRVLYATLTYLRDFVVVRLDKINELANKYDGKAYIKKTVKVGEREVDFHLELSETKKNDVTTKKDDTLAELITRLNIILNDILILLRTDLMTEVSKAPAVTRPIVKTNVFKMNINFRESLALFDYISGYNEDGYKITPHEKVVTPLNEAQNAAFSELILFASFITYKHNNELSDILENRYHAEEKRRAFLRDEELLTRIDALMAEVKTSDREFGEYLLQMEQGYDVLRRKVEEARNDLLDAVNQHAEEVERIEEVHAGDISKMNAEHEAALEVVHEKHEAALLLKEEELKAEFEAKEVLNAALLVKEAEVAKIKQESDAKVAAIQEKMTLLEAELLTHRITKGKAPKAAQMTSRQRFMQLQEQKRVLDKYFDNVWKETKQSIRRRHLRINKTGGGKKRE